MDQNEFLNTKQHVNIYGRASDEPIWLKLLLQYNSDNPDPR